MMLLIVDLVAVPGKRAELVEHVHTLLGDAADGLLQYTVGTTAEHPDAIVIVEEWHDAATHEAFMQTEHFATFRTQTRDLHAAPPASRTFDIDVPAAPETPIISLL
jgi:quinol monooxygenase YgiN